jgi:hypothetical protein
MTIAKLRSEDREKMDAEPEVAMNIQIVKRGQEYAVVVAGRIAITYDEAIISELNRLNEILQSPPEAPTANYGERLENWTENLQTSRPVTPVPVDEAFTVLGMIHLGPRSPLPRTPWRPSYVYGHLPFHGLASGNDIFYRYEAYPTSRRIDRTTHKVVKANSWTRLTSIRVSVRWRDMHCRNSCRHVGDMNSDRSLERPFITGRRCRCTGSRAAVERSYGAGGGGRGTFIVHTN